MSASDPDSKIDMLDPPDIVKRKLKRVLLCDYFLCCFVVASPLSCFSHSVSQETLQRMEFLHLLNMYCFRCWKKVG